MGLAYVLSSHLIHYHRLPTVVSHLVFHGRDSGMMFHWGGRLRWFGY